MRTLSALLVLPLVLAGSMAAAQSSPQGVPLTTTTTAPNLAQIIPDLYGPNGLKVDSAALLPDGSTHSAHFNSAFQSTSQSVTLITEFERPAKITFQQPMTIRLHAGTVDVRCFQAAIESV